MKIQNRFDKAVASAYHQRMLYSWKKDWTDPVYDNETVRYYVSSRWRKRLKKYGVVPGNADNTLVAGELGRVLYLDVGRWGGGAATADHTDAHWGRSRYFGIVFGWMAALCEYPIGGTGGDGVECDDSLISATTKKHLCYGVIKEIANRLSNDKVLGRVRIRTCIGINVQSSFQPAPATIILGDLHVPVMDAAHASRTNFGSSTVDVPRKGRINPHDLGAFTIPGLDVPDLNAQALAAIPGAAKLYLQERVEDWSDNDRMLANGAAEWVNRITGGAKRGADIFDGAGADLGRFVDVLLRYQHSPDVGPVQAFPELSLIQVGDLFELWIGLRRVVDNGGVDEPFNMEAARKFVDFWITETLVHTNEGRHISRLINIDNEAPSHKPFNAKTLIGNHDNYLGTVGNAGGTRGGVWSAGGMFTEHGHEIDEYNRDSSPLKGWMITQSAWLYPDLRFLEHPLLATLPVADTFCPARLRFFHRAVKKIVYDTMGIYGSPGTCFAMGHTHMPILRELLLVDARKKKRSGGGAGGSADGGGAGGSADGGGAGGSAGDATPSPPTPSDWLPDGLELPEIIDGLDDFWPPPGW